MIEHINNNEGGGDVRSKLNEVIDLTNQVPNKVERLTTAQNGNVAVWQDGNLIDGGVSAGGGVDVNIPDWIDVQGDPLPLGFVVRFSGRLWVSKVEDNQNNQPPIDSEVDENDYWIVTSESEASGTPIWYPGLYKTQLAEVFVLNTGDNKYYKYILRATVPYVSSDFETELIAGIWQSSSGTTTAVLCDQSDVETANPTENTKFTSALRAFQGWIFWMKNSIISDLPSTVKTYYAAIIQLFDLKQRANPSWDLSTVPKAEDLVINEGAKTITFGTINGAPLSVNNPAIYRIDQIDGTSKKYLITSPQVFTYTATYGIWWIYFGDSGGVIVNGGALQFGRMAPLLRFVYSTDDNVINTRVAEFHPDTLSAVAHKRAHSEGTVWISGGDVTANPITTGAPNADGRNTVIGLSSVTNMDDNFEYTVQNSTGGGNWQQDLGTNVAASLTSSNSGIFNITYNQATGSRLRVIQGTRYPFPWNVATNRPQTISELGVFTEVPNNYFFCSFIYVLQDFKTGEAVRLRTSTVAFATIEEARAYSWDTLKGFSPTLSDNEIRQHLKCIWEVKTAWSASCKYAALRETQYLRQNPLTTVTAGSVSVTASNTTVDTTSFNGNLDNTVTNVQILAQKVDDLTIASDVETLNVTTPAKTKKLLKVDALGTGVDFTDYSFDEVLQTSAIDYSQPTWLVGESRLLLTTKLSSTEGNFEGAAELMDLFLPPGVLTTLESSDSNWTNETKTVIGDNSTYALGRTGQFGWLSDRTFVQCTSASYAVSGSATFNRNRAVDALNISDTQDLAVINLLEPSRTGGTDDDGWNLTTQTKVITTVPCKVGTYWVGGTNGEGNWFTCFAQSGTSYYWKRLGTPASIQRPITATSHPTLTGRLLAKADWATSLYTVQAGDETSYQDQTFWDTATRAYFIKVTTTQWEKIK